jgi:hypothetical protein
MNISHSEKTDNSLIIKQATKSIYLRNGNDFSNTSPVQVSKSVKRDDSKEFDHPNEISSKNTNIHYQKLNASLNCSIMDNTNNLNNSTHLFLKQSKTEQEVCKVCYEPGKDDNKLIYPCKCEGSMKYIHDICLKKWINKNHKDPLTAFCEICKYSYIMVFNYEKVFSKELFKKHLKRFIISFILTVVVLFLFGEVIYIIFTL